MKGERIEHCCCRMMYKELRIKYPWGTKYIGKGVLLDKPTRCHTQNITTEYIREYVWYEYVHTFTNSRISYAENGAVLSPAKGGPGTITFRNSRAKRGAGSKAVTSTQGTHDSPAVPLLQAPCCCLIDARPLLLCFALVPCSLCLLVFTKNEKSNRLRQWAHLTKDRKYDPAQDRSS